MLRGRAIGVQMQRKRHAHPGQITRSEFEFEVAASITGKVDPSRLQRLIAFRHDRGDGSLQRPEIPLPGDRFALPPGVGRVVVTHFPHQQARRIDHGDAHPLRTRIASGEHDGDRVLQPPGGIGQDCGELLRIARLAGNAGHLHLPGARISVH